MQPPRLRNYINGAWCENKAAEALPVTNPSTGEILTEVPLSSVADTSAAVAAAQAAFPAWARTPVATRVQYLFRLRAELEAHAVELGRLIVTEMGKSLPDAEAEVKRALQNLEMACGMPHLIQGHKVAGVASGLDTETIRLPVGVFASMTPFNFPLMVPFWFFPYAIAAGNTYVFKPSEQTPLSMNRVLELIDGVRLPKGVVNLVHGDRRVSEALVTDPRVAGISFVGSSVVARQIAQGCVEQRKRYQALGSAKNYLVVMPDAEMKHTLANMLTSCFGCAGERCMAASVVACIGDETYDRVCREFIAAARNIVVGDPLATRAEKGVFVMGPVISAKARRRILEEIDAAVRAGIPLLLDGRQRVREDAPGFFIGPTIFGDVPVGCRLERTEVFGPVVALMRFKTLDEAIAAINAHPYGNGASIYTRSGGAARHFEVETQCGMIGINVGVPAPVAYFPFGGSKDSNFSQIKAQGSRVVDFFTEERIITRRFDWQEA